MSETAATVNQFIPQAVLLAIRANMYRRPLWKPSAVMALLDLEFHQVTSKIENGDFPFAFDISAAESRKTEPRIFAFSLVEKFLGPNPKIGATRNLELPDVLKVILPARDIRSTELKRLLSCKSSHVSKLKPFFVISKKAKDADGPNSYCVFSRASVAKFLEKRRML